jgi:hypothetical protein
MLLLPVVMMQGNCASFRATDTPKKWRFEPVYGIVSYFTVGRYRLKPQHIQ